LSRDRAGVASDGHVVKPAHSVSQADRVYLIRYRFAADRGTSHAPTGLREGQLPGNHKTYTNTNNPTHTTSTKCQYQLAASKPN
jgi:hypothetical protein